MVYDFLLSGSSGMRGRKDLLEARFKFLVRTLFLLAVLLVVPIRVTAHQPRVTTQLETAVTDPTVSKAYYGVLNGSPHVYRFVATEPFDLYVNVLVPDTEGQSKDITATLKKDGEMLAVLAKPAEQWTRFFEEFGRSWYWKGPEYQGVGAAGSYEIVVASPRMDTRYSLAVGEKEAFNLAETWNAFRLVPSLKRDFFQESPAGFLASPLGVGYVGLMFLAAAAFGLAYRFALKRFAAGTVRARSNNIGSHDRLVRVLIGLGLFIGAVTTGWSPVLLFFAGFCFFEAAFSWCGFYAALGKNTCPRP